MVYNINGSKVDASDYKYEIVIILWEKDGKKFKKKVGGEHRKIVAACSKLATEYGAKNIQVIETC